MIYSKLETLRARANEKLEIAARQKGQIHTPLTYDLIHTKTGISKDTLTRFKRDRQKRVDVDVVNRLLNYFSRILEQPLSLGDILEYIPDEVSEDSEEES